MSVFVVRTDEPSNIRYSLDVTHDTGISGCLYLFAFDNLPVLTSETGKDRWESVP